MSKFTPLNIEQSVAKFFADKLILEGYQIYWKDTKQTEGVASDTVTILRQFPEEAAAFALPDVTQEAGIVKVPAFSVFANLPSTNETKRMGLGESIFEWDIGLRIDGFLDTELRWYQFAGLFQGWFGNPDTRITIYDWEADLNNASPPALTPYLQLDSTDIVRQELAGLPAARYYLSVNTNAKFIE